MTTINKSILNKNNFRLLIDKIPTVEYYVKTVNIPGLQFSEVAQPAGIGLDAFFPGDKVAFDTLDVTFLVDEDLENLQDKIAKKHGYKVIRHTHQIFVKPLKK